MQAHSEISTLSVCHSWPSIWDWIASILCCLPICSLAQRSVCARVCACDCTGVFAVPQALLPHDCFGSTLLLSLLYLQLAWKVTHAARSYKHTHTDTFTPAVFSSLRQTATEKQQTGGDFLKLSNVFLTQRPLRLAQCFRVRWRQQGFVHSHSIPPFPEQLAQD